jgi:hypothetical protein
MGACQGGIGEHMTVLENDRKRASDYKRANRHQAYENGKEHVGVRKQAIVREQGQSAASGYPGVCGRQGANVMEAMITRKSS